MARVRQKELGFFQGPGSMQERDICQGGANNFTAHFKYPLESVPDFLG